MRIHEDCCLQTCVACILDVDVFDVPPQTPGLGAIEYHAQLDIWLRARNMTLKWVPPYDDVRTYRKAFQEHIMCGEMVGMFGGGREDHCVVGLNGGMIWDPYPTRGGLVKLKWFGLLVNV